MSRCNINKTGCTLALIFLFLVILVLRNVELSSTEAILNKDENLSYGIIIDAGSTGSRLFLYSWSSSSAQELIDIKPVYDFTGHAVVKKVSPGLSTFGDTPEKAAEYIQPLLDYAMEYIPPKKIPYTPIFIFATAGMRLLPIEKQNAVIERLREDLPKRTKLQVIDDHIKIIPGKWEGIYSWIAVNYILQRFRIPPTSITSSYTSASIDRPKTAGMIDMGGASVQIAFELPPNSKFNNEHVEVINLGSSDDDPRFRYRLFVTTFLGFGVNEGAKKYEQLLANEFEQNSANLSAPIPYVSDGCLPLNRFMVTEKSDGSQFVRKGNGNWDICVRKITQILTNSIDHTDSECPSPKSCYFGGVQVPPVSMSEIELYGFSEYWFSVEDVLALGGVYNHSQFEEKARSFCSQRWSTIKSNYKLRMYPKADEERLQTQCFKSAWIHAILHDGFFVGEELHKFKSAFKIADQEVQWALGAMIYNMRYFPLGSSQRSEFANQRHVGSPGINVWNIGYILLIALGIGILLNWLKLRYMNKGRGPIRDPSNWGYKRVDQDDSYNLPRSLRTNNYPV